MPECAARYANPLRQPTTPTHYANPLRQSTTPIHYANPLRQSTTPTLRAGLVALPDESRRERSKRLAELGLRLTCLARAREARPGLCPAMTT